MGMSSHRARHAAERANPVPRRNPNNISWEAHQSALVEAVRGYQLEILSLKAGGGSDTEVAEANAKCDEVTALLSAAASENESLLKQVSELTELLAMADAPAEKKPEEKKDEKPAKPDGGKAGNKPKGSKH